MHQQGKRNYSIKKKGLSSIIIYDVMTLKNRNRDHKELFIRLNISNGKDFVKDKFFHYRFQ